jgi:acetoin utilization deacetylase AcuC-like enzyme
MSAKFKPDLIIISAGFDSHNGDPLGQLKLEDDDFIAMTASAMQWASTACNGRIVSCLEGGYNLKTLGKTVRAHVTELHKEADETQFSHAIRADNV